MKKSTIADLDIQRNVISITSKNKNSGISIASKAQNLTV